MNDGNEQDAIAAYAPLEPLLLAVRNQTTPDERYPLLVLALRATLHPALAPYRADPLLPLAGKFISLEARIGAIRAALQALSRPDAIRGSIGGALYLPGYQEATACTITVSHRADVAPLDHWETPLALHPVSSALASSAQKAFDTALQYALFDYPGATPPVPGRLFWAIESVASDDILAATAGDSLELPLTLAFLSALTGLTIPTGIGATGAVRAQGVVGKVGYVREKRAAYEATNGAESYFLTPAEGGTVAEIARQINTEWQGRFAERPRRSQEPVAIVGTPTFLWAEIENAPALWHEHARVFRQALGQYHKLFVDAIGRHGGSVFAEVVGASEGMGAVFPCPDQAVQTAIFLLRSVRAAVWDAALGASLPVRIGLHQGSGEPLANQGWRGAGPAGAARIAGAASAGQILASDAMHYAASEVGTWYGLGAHRLRDFSEAVTLWLVGSEGLPTVFAPPDSLNTRRHNLPLADTPLIGRAALTRKLLGLLAKKRLVTLVGAGGVGKTRVAIATAADALLDPATANRFADGAFTIALDAIESTATALMGAVCEAVGLPVRVGIGEALATKSLLLVLDNAESMIEIAAQFVRTLQTVAPNIICLVTSRVPLQVSGETRETIPPLELPAEGSEGEAWENTPAVRLFLDRATEADPAFAVTTEEGRDAVTRLLHRLDGLPLAIELAAARTRQLPIVKIEARLTESLALLSTRQSDVPLRQRTLVATIEWSYGLLAEPERALLRRISVFVGGFSAEAAEAVSDHDPNTLDALAVLEEIGLLVCRRLEIGSEPRFGLLQTVLDFAQEKLRANPEERDAVRHAYSEYYARLAAEHGAIQNKLSANETEAFDILDRELTNLRSAWMFWREQGDQETRGEFAANLSDFLRRRGHTRERLEWIESALATTTPMKVETRYRLLHAHTITLKDAGRIEEAEALAETFMAFCSEKKNKGWIAEANLVSGTVATRAKRYAAAETYFEQANRNFIETGNQHGTVSVLVNRAMNAIRLGDDAQARRLCEKAVEIAREFGDEHGSGYAHNNLGYLDNKIGDHVAAYNHFMHHLRYCRNQRDTTGVAIVTFNIGEELLRLNELKGLPLIVTAHELLSRLGHSYASSADTEIEDWARKLNVGSYELAAMRRTANRSTLPQLRNIPIPDLPVMPNRDLVLS